MTHTYCSPELVDFGSVVTTTATSTAGTQSDGSGALKIARSSVSGSSVETASETNGD
jgi:hypothetical protein